MTETQYQKLEKESNNDWKNHLVNGWTVEPRKKSHKAAVASLVLSVIGLFFFGFFLGIAGTALGAFAIGKKDKWGYAGIILGVTMLVLYYLS